MSDNNLKKALEKKNQEQIIYYADKLNQDIIDKHRRFPDFTYSEAQIRSNLSTLKEVENYLTIELSKEIPNLNKIYNDLLLSQAIVFLTNSDYTTSFDYLQRAIMNYENSNDEGGLAESYLSMGDVHIISGNKEKALPNYESSLNLFEKSGDINKLMSANNHIAVWSGFAGEISLSIEYFEKSLAISLKYDEITIQAAAYHGLGWNYKTQGELDTALNYFNKSLDKVFEMKKEQPDFYFYYFNMWLYQHFGDIFLLKKDFLKAFDNYKKSLDISIDLNHTYASAWNYYLLITLFLEHGKLQDAKDYLVTFEKYHNTIKENLTVEMIYELSFGLVLQKKGTHLDKKLAQRRFLKVINSQIQFKKIKIHAMLYLSELLFDSLVDYTDSKQTTINIIKQLKALYIELREIAKYQSSQHLIIRSAILESKIAKHEFHYGKALRLLNQAHKLATQRGLTLLMEKISSEYKELFKKGDKPFIILLFLLVKERSLTEISDFLNISKTATSKHLKLLSRLELIIISKEKKVRSDNIKAKYYKLSSQAYNLLSPLEISLNDVFEKAIEDPFSLREEFDSMKFILRIWNKFHKLAVDYIKLIENYVIPEAQGLNTNGNLRKGNNFASIIKNINQNDSFKMFQYPISSDQYQEFLDYWNEFNLKVNALIEKNKVNNKMDENRHLIFTLFIPLNALLDIESFKKKREIQ
ncbi:MAG: tetratricopeptide repeat protein [Promethearchaeota archaeon]